MRGVGSISGVAVLAAALWVMACAAGSGSPTPRGSSSAAAAEAPPQSGEKRPGSFPSPDELEKLGDEPTPENLFTLDVEPVDEWKLAGPFPEQMASIPYSDPEDPWSALLEAAARRRAGLVVPTEAMYCVARELGRFYLAHGAQPTDSLREFLTARCNAAVSHVGLAYVDGAVKPRHHDATIYGYWRESVMDLIHKSLAGGPRSVGIWYGREADHAVVMVVYGHRNALVEPLSPFADEHGRIEIRGEVLEPANQVQALVNRGDFGVEPCEQPADVELPLFHFICRLERNDLYARISVSYSPPGRLLHKVALSVMAWPGTRTTETYHAPRYVDAHPLLSAEKASEDFVSLLNEVRRDADLEPLELDTRQSQVASKLAPHFFSAIFQNAPMMTADLIVLGMMAGWYVDGIVESGHFTAGWVMHSNDLGALLSTALERPAAREALLADDVERIAIGSMVETREGHQSLAAIFGTYALFAAETHDAMSQRVFQKIEAELRARGYQSPKRLIDVAGPCQQAAARVHAGGDKTDALNDLLRQSADMLQRPVNGWIAEVRDIEKLQIPLEFISRPSLGVAVSVTHRRVPGEAWGTYVVMLVVADPEAFGA